MNKPDNLKKLSRIARVIMNFNERNIDDEIQADTIDTMISDLHDYCTNVERIQEKIRKQEKKKHV